MRRLTIKRLDAVSVAKLSATIYAILGLIIGGLVSIVAILGAVIPLSDDDQGARVLGIFFGVGAVIFFPVFYGVIGFIGGLIMAGLYNLVAPRVGGVWCDVEEG
jgi:hypothetical protein